MIIRTALPCLALAAVAFLPIANTTVSPDPAPLAQDDVVIQTIPVSGNVSMLVGQGGNIGVSVGPGSKAFDRTPRAASWMARDLESAMMAALAA